MMSRGRLRVLHVLNELRPSGAECMLVVAAREFAKRGVVSDVLATGRVPGPYSDRMAGAGYRLHHLPFEKSIRFFLNLHRQIRGRYDVVHVHTERANFWIALTALLAGIPVVVRSIHNTFDFSGALRMRRAVQRRMLRWLGVRQVAVGRSVQETEERRFGVKPIIVANWYDSERFVPPTDSEREHARSQLGIKRDEMVIASLGNCSPVKNHAALIEALAALPSSGRPLYLHAGIEEEGHPERALAEKLGIAARVRFLGPLEDPRKALYAADAFVMPSLREGFSIAAIEALAVGLPVIATKVPGLKDLGDLFAGIMYAEPVNDSLTAVLRRLTALSDEERRTLAQGNAVAARQEFGLTAGVDKYLDLYGTR